MALKELSMAIEEVPNRMFVEVRGSRCYQQCIDGNGIHLLNICGRPSYTSCKSGCSLQIRLQRKTSELRLCVCIFLGMLVDNLYCCCDVVLR